MDIVKKGKALSPKYKRHEHPINFKSKKEEEKYWEKEIQRWHLGYYPNDNFSRTEEKLVTGRHYFYLQEVQIPTISDGLIYPNWRDGDEAVAEMVDKCFKDSWDGLIGKRRGFGLTSFMGAIGLHTALTVPNTIVPLTSADKTRVENILTNILTPAYSGLNNYYKPPLSTDRKDELAFADKDFDYVERNGKQIKLKRKGGIQTRIIPRQTHLKPTAFENIRAVFGFLDEIFLHPKANEVKASMRMCFGSGLKKKGVLMMGGSAGEEDSKGLEVAANMWFDAVNIQLNTLFIPAWMSDPDFSTNGHSDKEAALEFILSERERLSRASDLTEYRNYIRSMPLTVDEMFAIKKSEVFPPEIVQKLNDQKIIIKSNPKPIQIGRLIDLGDTIKFEPDLISGKIHIIEPPSHDDILRYSNLYIAGTDPIPFEGDNEKEGSKFAHIVHKRTAETPVAYFMDRSLDADYIAEQSILLSKFYGNAKNLIEQNRGGTIAKLYRENAKELLAYCPTACDLVIAGRKRKVGVRATAANNRLGVDELIYWLNKNCGNLWFPELVEQLLKYGMPGQADDLVDAFKWCILAHKDWAAQEVKSVQQQRTIRYSKIIKTSRGWERQYVTKTI